MTFSLTPLQRAILGGLVSSDEGLSAFTIHKRFSITAGDLAASLTPLERRGLILISGTQVVISPEKSDEALSLLFKNRQSKNFLKPNVRSRRDFQQPKTMIGQPILPWIPLLDRIAFEARRQFENTRKPTKIEEPASVENNNS